MRERNLLLAGIWMSLAWGRWEAAHTLVIVFSFFISLDLLIRGRFLQKERQGFKDIS